MANYTTVNILLHKNHKTKKEDEKYFVLETPPSQGIPHLVTKNKSEEIRYTLYRRVVWKDINELSQRTVWKDIREIK